MNFMYEPNWITTIQHRCVALLYRINPIERFMLKAQRLTPKAKRSPMTSGHQFLIPNSIFTLINVSTNQPFNSIPSIP